jgi:hypothetical protein
MAEPKKPASPSGTEANDGEQKLAASVNLPRMEATGPGDPDVPLLHVELKPSGPSVPQPSREFWKAIRTATNRIAFPRLHEYLDKVFCVAAQESGDNGRAVKADHGAAVRSAMIPHLQSVHGYRLLKAMVELFLLRGCGFKWTLADEVMLSQERGEIYNDTFNQVAQYLKIPAEQLRNSLTSGDPHLELHYFGKVRAENLTGNNATAAGPLCKGVLDERVDIRTAPCLLELIWNYWHEQGALVQAINVVALRFQNRIDPQGRNPLVNLNLAPLHGISPLLFGYIQDEYNRLTIQRRAYEYDHHYGLTLYGKAVKPLQSVDSRSKFIEAFHHLLHRTARFYRQDDDLTVKADGFPVLQALKEVHLLLTQGMHNQYGDLPWTSRVEMLVQEWLLARPEIAQFLNSRPMVPYQEGWMAQVDTLKKMFGWPEASVSHFRDLGVFGEQLLLSIRFHLWLNESSPDPAAEWAREWRPEIQSYIHAYRAVTGVDLLVEPVNTTPPSTLLRDRLTQAPSAV